MENNLNHEQRGCVHDIDSSFPEVGIYNKKNKCHLYIFENHDFRITSGKVFILSSVRWSGVFFSVYLYFLMLNVRVYFYLLNYWIHAILPFLTLKQMDQENWTHIAILFHQADTLLPSTSGAQHHGTFPHNILTLNHQLKRRVWGLLSTANFSNESQLCEHLC